MIRIREYSGEDTIAMAHLISELGYPCTPADVTARFARLSPDLYQTLVAESAETLVGFIGLVTLPVYEHSHPLGWILALSVDSKYRRQGIGRALVKAAEEYFAGHHVTDVRLHSSLPRADAHAFYETLGYDKTGYRFRKNL